MIAMSIEQREFQHEVELWRSARELFPNGSAQRAASRARWLAAIETFAAYGHEEQIRKLGRIRAE